MAETEPAWHYSESAPYTPQPIGQIVEFLVKDNVHRVHLNPEGGRCFGRVFALAYPFGWQHFYCQEKCCDHRGKSDDVGEDMGRVHVKCIEDWTFTKYSYCLDCGQVGIIRKEEL